MTDGPELLGREGVLEHWLDLADEGEANREAHHPLRRALRELTSSEAQFGLAEDGIDPCVLALDGRRLAVLTPVAVSGENSTHVIVYRSLALMEDCAIRIESQGEAPIRGDLTRRTWTLGSGGAEIAVTTRAPHNVNMRTDHRGDALMRRAAEQIGIRLGS